MTLMRLGALVAGLVLAGMTGVALGSSGSGPAHSILLSPGMAVGYAGLTCTAYKGTTSTNAQLVCVRNDLQGFGVIVSQEQVLVAKNVNGKIVVLFRRKQ
jgi:hypothetical protein